MRSVCQSVLAKRLQQIHYHPTARLTSQPGQGRGGRGPRQTANNAALVRACNKRTEGTCLNFRARPLLTQKDGLYTPPPPTSPSPPPPPPPIPPPHHHHHPLPPHPNPPSTGGEKTCTLWELNCACTFFFYLVLVDVMGKLCLSLSPSLPLSPSLRLSCAWDAHALHRTAVARRIQTRVLAAILKSPPPNNTVGIFEGSIQHITLHSDPVVLHLAGTASALIWLAFRK